MTETRYGALRRLALAAGLAMAALLAGCATTTPGDPLEPYNRAMFAVNDKVDAVALKPAARVYKKVLPEFAQTGVNNFFGNLSDAWIGVNNILQGKPKQGLSDFGRVALNSTVGIFGLVDVASGAGLEKHNEDFGQTLGKWGVPAGPYFVLPVLGPSTVRDSLALPLDLEMDPLESVRPVHTRNAGNALRVIDQRAVLLDTSNLMEEAALDRYQFYRDGYLQRRLNQVHDGEVPEAAEDNDDEQATEQPADTEVPEQQPAPAEQAAPPAEHKEEAPVKQVDTNQPSTAPVIR